MTDGAEPVSRYERSGDWDDFIIGIVGEAEEDGASYVEVHLVSREDDPVGWVMVAARYRDDDGDGEANVLIDGNQAAMLAVVLQDAARQWHDRDVTHNWQTQGGDD